MKKYFLTFCVALIVGFFLCNFFIRQYKGYNGIKVSFEGEEVYFIQYGVFSSIDNMEKNTIALENYIYDFSENKYYVYIGITCSENISFKIIDYFKKLGYETIVKKYNVSNAKFIKALKNYDTVLENTVDETVISSIINQALMKYEEVVINGS